MLLYYIWNVSKGLKGSNCIFLSNWLHDLEPKQKYFIKYLKWKSLPSTRWWLGKTIVPLFLNDFTWNHIATCLVKYKHCLKFLNGTITKDNTNNVLRTPVFLCKTLDFIYPRYLKINRTHFFFVNSTDNHQKGDMPD